MAVYLCQRRSVDDQGIKKSPSAGYIQLFLGLLLLAPFSRHPWMTGVQMICLCLLYFYHNRSLKKFLPFIGLIVIVALTNPLFVQRGRTILYADTHVRITKEALLYGIHYGCVLVNLLLVFSIFNQYIKKEQWIYLSGRFFPKLGVVTSMAFGLIPRYQNHAKKILKDTKILKIRTCSAASDAYCIDGNDMGI